MGRGVVPCGLREGHVADPEDVSVEAVAGIASKTRAVPDWSPPVLAGPPSQPGRRPSARLRLPAPSRFLTFSDGGLILLGTRRSSDLHGRPWPSETAGPADACFGRSCVTVDLGPAFRPSGEGLRFLGPSPLGTYQFLRFNRLARFSPVSQAPPCKEDRLAGRGSESAACGGSLPRNLHRIFRANRPVFGLPGKCFLAVGRSR